MIIYAFYGLGKTTLCSECPEKFVEVDEEYALSDFSFDIEAITNYITALSRDRIVFINGKLFLIEGIDPDLAFIPENYEMIEERLLSRGVGKSFLNNLRRIYEDIIQDIKRKCKIVITVRENNYLSQYVNMTEKKGEGNVGVSLYIEAGFRIGFLLFLASVSDAYIPNLAPANETFLSFKV